MISKKADMREMRKLYRERVLQDFPRSEIKPFGVIRAMVRRGIYGCLTVLDGEDSVSAYFFYVIDQHRRVLFVDYFAVDAARRGSGIGSESLRVLFERFPDMEILLEVEDPEKADGKEEEKLRRRRIAFYERAGFCMTALRVILFGVDFRIMVRGGRAPDDPACRQDLVAVYDRMFPHRRTRRAVQVYE